MPNVFYVKNKPQKADIIDLVLEYNRVFIGYPPWKKNVTREPERIREALYDLKRDSFDKSDLHSDLSKNYKTRVTRHRNMAKEIQAGDFVIVPRVGSGECYIGKVASPFELDINLDRYNKYLKLRKAQKKDTNDKISHLGDVLLSWKVEEFNRVPFPLIPRWIHIPY